MMRRLRRSHTGAYNSKVALAIEDKRMTDEPSYVDSYASVDDLSTAGRKVVHRH